MTGSTATLRRRLLGVLTATGLGGTVALVLSSAPTAVSATDPCAASEIAKTISNVSRSAGDYLDGHPQTNQAMTFALQQGSGPQSLDPLRAYFEANPKAASDLQTIALPLAGMSSRCQMPPISLPQALGFSPSAQGGSPVVSGSQGGPPVVSGSQGGPPVVSGTQGGSPVVSGTQGASPAVSGAQGVLPRRAAEAPLGVVK